MITLLWLHYVYDKFTTATECWCFRVHSLWRLGQRRPSHSVTSSNTQQHSHSKLTTLCSTSWSPANPSARTRTTGSLLALTAAKALRRLQWWASWLYRVPAQLGVAQMLSGSTIWRGSLRRQPHTCYVHQGCTASHNSWWLNCEDLTPHMIYTLYYAEVVPHINSVQKFFLYNYCSI